MKTIFPNISESSKECKSLVNIITKTVRKVSTNDETKEQHDAVLVICKTLMKLFPQRALFSILQRWSQKPKNHFLMDAINEVTVLASHYGQLRMDQFLDKARTWQVCPANSSKTGRKKLLLSYVPANTDQTKYEHIALKVDVSLKLMTTTMKGIEDVIFTRYKRNSVSKPVQFKLRQKTTILAPTRERDVSAAATNKEDNDEEDDLNKNNDFVFDSKPLQGLHMPASFKTRLWRSVEHIDLGRVLVRILFGSEILKRKMFPSTLYVEERFLSFLFQMTADCKTREMYVSILAHLCIAITDVNDIHGKSTFIGKCVDHPEEISRLASNQASTGATSVIADQIVKAFNSLAETSPRTSKYSGWNDEKKCQCIRNVVFKRYLPF